MPKIKSSQQIPKFRDGQGNLMLDAKPRVAGSIPAGRVLLNADSADVTQPRTRAEYGSGLIIADY